MDNQSVKIAPSILAADFARLGDDVTKAQAAGADLIHIDVMDGRFVPNISMGPFVVEAVGRVTDLPLDVHLMIVEPERYVEAFVQAGAHNITVHLEASPNLHRTLQHIQELGCHASVALNPHTPPESIYEVLHLLKMVLVMTVNPGFGGQTFIQETMAKVAKLREVIQNRGLDVEIEVDGGIDADTAVMATSAGATVLVAGSSIFGHQNGIKAGIDALRRAVATP